MTPIACRYTISFFICSSLLALALSPLHANADSKTISTTAVPLKNNEIPALDLVDKDGNPLDADAAADMRKKKGQDLSLLNPRESDVWSNTKLSAIDTSTSYPAEAALLQWKDTVKLNPEGWHREQVQGANAKGEQQTYRLLVSMNVHQALMRAALLRKLGFPIASPRWYKQLSLKFPNKVAVDNFIANVSTKTGLYDNKRWVLRNDEKTNVVVLQDVMLEPSTIDVPTSFYMGNLNATHIKGRRALRSLLVPFVLLDVPESIDMYSWEVVQTINQAIVFTHKYASSFNETTLDDVRWISERLGRLSTADWSEIVAAGKFPGAIGEIVLQKTIARRNGMVAMTGVKVRLPAELQRLHYEKNINGEGVRAGKVVQGRFAGYAANFTYGQPESPLKTDDIVRFINIEATSSALSQLTSRINEELQFLNMDRLLQDRTEKLNRAFYEHIQKNPTKPFVKPVASWGGFTAGAGVSATRSLVTGSYYGQQSSDFRVSLVDQIAARGRIGYFLGIDGYEKVLPSIGANLSIVRSYVHSRPVVSVEAASKQSWRDLWVPKFMKGLAGMLAISGAEKPEDRVKEMNENLAKFTEELKDDELFTISDILSFDQNATLNIPLTTLLGMDPVSYNNGLALSTYGSQAVIRRTTITRENGYIKIYLQNIQSQMVGVAIDLNFWMNIMRMSWEHKWGRARTRAYHLDEKPTSEADLRKTILAVKGVLQANNSEILENSFNYIHLDHRTESQVENGRFFFKQWTELEEWHRVKVQPQRDPEKGILDPKRYERTLFSHRMMDRSGENYYASFGDFLDGTVQKSKLLRGKVLANNSGMNPKDSFFGEARWRVTSTEAEVTKGREGSPVTIIENYWAGWDLSKKNLFKILGDVDTRVKQLGLSMPMVNRDVFHEMKRLQLFEVRSTLVVYEAGMEKLRSRLLVKGGKRCNALASVFGCDEHSGRDPEIVEKVLIPMYGTKRFQEYCADLRIGAGARGGATGKLIQGRSYDCIMPWMSEVLDLRREYPTDREEQVKWNTRLMNQLEANVDLARMVKWIGAENLYYQVKISGFRTNDANGDTADYTSSTVGMYDRKAGVGVFKDFISDYEITSNEMNASYLSEGN